MCKMKPPIAMRIELGSQKLPPNIIPVDYEYQLLCAFTIDQSILARSNALITLLKARRRSRFVFSDDFESFLYPLGRYITHAHTYMSLYWLLGLNL